MSAERKDAFSDWVLVTVASTKGSAPRACGAAMQVFGDHITGSIGGGALEWEAMRIARQMLSAQQGPTRRVFPLGPDLGQCCGGSVTLAFTPNGTHQPPRAAPLWIWGAGHVGRAIARTMAPLNDRDSFLVDVAADRFPGVLPDGVSPVVAQDPLRVVARAAEHADHLIATYSHDLDLALCDALLRQPCASIGLIGSVTKWARFRARLASMGHADDQIARIACPIGNPDLGKHPQAIAVGVATALLSRTMTTGITAT